jgi:hypothetical protein
MSVIQTFRDLAVGVGAPREISDEVPAVSALLIIRRVVISL